MSLELQSPAAAVRDDKGLKHGAIGVVSATVIGVASTAPAYSMAATLGLLAVVVGMYSPAIMLIAFIPMLFTAAAYYYLNRVDPDCGATFPWVTRAMGPNAGWLGGWGVIAADIVVMPSLAWVAAYYTYSLFGLDDLASNTWALLILGTVFILAMTLITWMGIELSARTQFALLGIEIAILVGFSAWAIAKVYLDHPAGSTPLSWQWMNPFNLTLDELSKGVLLALFIYWGWDTAANVNEETRGRTSAGIATVASTLVLLGTYMIVAFATTAYRGPGFLGNNPDDALTTMVGGPWDKLLMLAILTSAMASTQTTILPTARTSLSMAAHGALPKPLAKIHPKYLTPTWSTWWFGIASVLWWIVLILVDRSENILWDSITRSRVRDRLLLRHHRDRRADPIPQARVQELQELPPGRFRCRCSGSRRWPGCSSGRRSTTGTRRTPTPRPGSRSEASRAWGRPWSSAWGCCCSGSRCGCGRASRTSRSSRARPRPPIRSPTCCPTSSA